MDFIKKEDISLLNGVPWSFTFKRALVQVIPESVYCPYLIPHGVTRHSVLTISEVCLGRKIVNDLTLKWCNGFTVEVWAFHLTFYRAANYLSMLGLKLIYGNRYNKG